MRLVFAPQNDIKMSLRNYRKNISEQQSRLKKAKNRLATSIELLEAIIWRERLKKYIAIGKQARFDIAENAELPEELKSLEIVRGATRLRKIQAASLVVKEPEPVIYP
jgi:hypothetical protein